MSVEPKSFVITSYSKKELQSLYNATGKTFNKWLNLIPDLGPYLGRKYTPAQVEKIVKHIGAPTIN